MVAYRVGKLGRTDRAQILSRTSRDPNLENPQVFFIKSAKLFFLYFSMFTMRTCSQLKLKMGAKRLKSLVL